MRDKQTLKKTIGNQLRQCRRSQGMKQYEVAHKIGYTTKQVLSSYERGVSLPTITSLIKLADLYGCSLDFLVGRDDIQGHQLYEDIQRMALERQKQSMIQLLRRFVQKEWQVEL